MSRFSSREQRSTCSIRPHAGLRPRRTCNPAEEEVWPGLSTPAGTCWHSPGRPTTCRRATSARSSARLHPPSCPAAQ
eukprot:833194-Rhodomonas_salina.1